MNRRTFLKLLNLQLLTFLLHYLPGRGRIAELTSAEEEHTLGYGTGPYGQGLYGGFQVYMPMVKKEENNSGTPTNSRK